MKRDVQVGVILGVIILAIIGVFLSTRTSVKEPIIPIPEIENGAQLNLLSINELPKNPVGTSQEEPEAQEYVVEGELKNTGVAEDKIAAGNEKQDAVIKGQEPKTENIRQEEKPAANVVTYKVQERDNLRKIARKYYGNEDKWLVIFNANQDKIYDRNNLRVGTELIIPNKETVSQATDGRQSTRLVSHEVTEQTANAKKHVVEDGDSLYKIAVKYYNDGSKWKKILDANKGNIKKNNVLKTGQELIIPDL
ncbi:MAG: LysM peptidoglycan-binding domain-containing protein [Planctomycetes bacterium]|nr:LysM peptidoglycan-binding domain-containing protein [Planctomycetota bacterium]